jgi:hypothetical protein
MHRSLAGLLASLLVTAACPVSALAAEAPTPPFAPGAHKLKNGQANELMVLGSVHLSQMPKSFDLAKLSLLNERLAEWRPQAVAIEEMSGLRCAYMRSYPQRYADATKTYCWDPAVARAATGLDVPEANAQVERLLAAWPASPTPAERPKQAARFLAAGGAVAAVAGRRTARR